MASRINSCRKGKAGERELAQWLRDLGAAGAERGQQHAGSADAPDVRWHVAWAHLEAKRVEALNVPHAVGRAALDAGPNRIGLVLHRRNRGSWIASCDGKQLVQCLLLLDRLLDGASPFASGAPQPCSQGAQGASLPLLFPQSELRPLQAPSMQSSFPGPHVPKSRNLLVRSRRNMIPSSAKGGGVSQEPESSCVPPAAGRPAQFLRESLLRDLL